MKTPGDVYDSGVDTHNTMAILVIVSNVYAYEFNDIHIHTEEVMTKCPAAQVESGVR